MLVNDENRNLVEIFLVKSWFELDIDLGDGDRKLRAQLIHRGERLLAEVTARFGVQDDVMLHITD